MTTAENRSYPTAGTYHSLSGGLRTGLDITLSIFCVVQGVLTLALLMPLFHGSHPRHTLQLSTKQRMPYYRQ